MIGVPIRGVVGEIRWAYYVAGHVEGFTAVPDAGRRARPGVPAGWSLKARVVLTDKYKMAQRPLVFVAPLERGRWQWPIESFTIERVEDREVLTARLGPLEET